ncbi:uncharacterized protein LOC111340681 [Stylophora pistillata]|uniref:uncharacterized protein LOC111340681 n=1 Tax=Stylophora pistillata TaxID=50429 RepID=UPI000C03C01F|nr:uncharacterized protein LOC111340681 [Stylophora pistillata]
MALSSQSSGSSYRNVYVSLYGKHTEACGSQSHPCRSIAQAVRRVSYGGNIYLEGRGTKKRPYGCANGGNTLMHYPGISVNKSLTFQGFYSTPHVSCTEGLHFQNENGEQLKFELMLSGIDFQQTPVICYDCQRITISNCSFHNASRALAIRIQNMTSFQLDMSSSTFRHNSQCISVLLFHNSKGKSQDITLKIKDAVFEKNGLSTGREIIQYRSAAEKGSRPVYIHVFGGKIKSSYNGGPFFDLKVANAITNETFEDVEIHHNGKRHKNRLRRLYFSHARETKAKFIFLNCHNNLNAQCIVVQSDRADIVIEESHWYNQSAALKRFGSCLSLAAGISASLRIVNSNFHNNEARAGGSLFANSIHGVLKVDLTNVTFSECKARTGYGCVISIGRTIQGSKEIQWGPHRLNFALRNVTVQQWEGNHGERVYRCVAIDIVLDGGTVTLEGSTFTKEMLTKGNGAISVLTTGGESNITILKCIFKDTSKNATEGNIIFLNSTNGNAGMVTISNSFIGNKENRKVALYFSPNYRVKLFNVTFISHRYALQTVPTPPKNGSFPVDISIDKCSFIDNIHDAMFTIHGPTSVQLTITSTLFRTNKRAFNFDEIHHSYAIRLMIPPLKHVHFSKAVIQLENNEFINRSASYFALLFEGIKNVTVRRSLFRNCRASAYKAKWSNSRTGLFYETAAGAISVLFNPDKPHSLGCVRSNSTHEKHPSWYYDSHVLFENTRFEENLGYEVGAVHIGNGVTVFRKCVFRDNFGLRKSGHVHSAYGTGSVEFKHCSFLKTKESGTFLESSQFDNGVFLYSESGGPLIFENTSMTSLKFNRGTYAIVDISGGGSVRMDKKSRMKCSKGEALLLDNGTHFQYSEKNKSICVLNVTVLKYSCKPCHPGYYSLQKGVSEGLFVASRADCHPCPFGATCIESNIAAKPNFWGYVTPGDQSMLKFIACPENYCLSTSSTSYNSCRGNRSGTLCGQCAEGFTETLFSTECRLSTKCNDYSVWVVTILLTIILALYLVIKPPILDTLRRQIFWFKKTETDGDHSMDDMGGTIGGEHSESGFLKITFYFYQAAETLIVGSVEDLIGKIPFIHFVISAYNFHVQSINQGLGCPFAGLTAVTKELFLSGTVIFTMANLVFIYAVHRVVNMYLGREKPSLIRYMAVVIEVLLLGYERLAETALKLMHCVPIGFGKKLFIDANVSCMQWWQYLLLAYIVIFLVPFIVVLYCGSFKLYRSSITAGEFVAAGMIPLPFLIYWLFKGMLKRRGEESSDQQVVNTDVSDILHGPFRPPTHNDNGTLYWESVLIGRRLVLLACGAFITDVMLRMVLLSASCLLITLHHVLKNPYRHPLANNVETFSLVTLSLIPIINLAKASPLSFGITTDGPNGAYLKSLEWFEVCALAFVPAIMSILIAFAILSQLVRFTLLIIEQLLRCCRKIPFYPWYKDQEQTPLLATAEHNLN